MTAQLDASERSFVLGIVNELQPDEARLAKDMMAPPRVFRPRSSAVGYGADVAIELVSPYAIIVGTWAYGIVRDEARSIADTKLRRITRRLLRIKDCPTPPATPDRSSKRALRRSTI